jgi:phage terminase large subunit GpA-like protein
LTPLPSPIAINPKWIAAAGGTEALLRASGRPVTRAGGALVVPVVFSRPERRSMRKKRQVPVSQWAERHRILPATARFAGPWRNSNVAYLAGIMDASFHPGVEEIIVCAAPQTGKTECVYTCLGYAADRRPGNVMVLFPNETDAKDNAKDRLAPMFNDSPRLREYLTGYSDDMGSLKIALQHMLIYMAWSNSPARLSNRPVMYAHADEEDKYPKTASKSESGPTDLLRKRMRTFVGVRKLWRTSSPTIEAGPIWVALTKEAQAVFDYFVKCPVCGRHQKMIFGDGDTKHGIKWTPGERDPLKIEATRDAWYQCAHCDAKWDDAARDMAVRNGEWRDRDNGWSIEAALKTIKPLRIGFHLPAWLSPFVPLWECAAAFLKGLKDKNKLKDFQNGYAAEPWKILEVERKESRILALADTRPAGVVPGGGVVAALLASVDTQDNGFWYEIRAFGFGLHPDTWCVRHGFVEGFDNLQRILLQDEYRDADGNRYPVHLVCQDAMGHKTSEVYDFCRVHRGIIIPTKGHALRRAQPFNYSNQEYYPGTKKAIPGGILLVNFDTNYFKNRLSSMLEVKPGDPGCWYYNSELDADYARQMCAEGIDPATGLWVNPNERPNHAFDCAVLLLLAAEILGVRFWAKPTPVQTSVEGQGEKPAKETMW